MRRSWPAGAELGVALAAAAAALAAVHALVVAVGLDAGDATASGIGPLWAATMIAIAIAAHLVQRRSRSPLRTRLVVAVLAGLAAGLAGAPLIAGLLHTDQPPYTVLGGDMAFRTEYVTRFATTWHLDDYTFRGLDAFYPPAWFWLAGRTAHVLGVVPWHVIKPFTILTLGAALLVAFSLWRVVLSPAAALSAAVGSSLLLTTHLPEQPQIPTQGWYSPYSCFVAITGVAWVAAVLPAVRDGAPRGRLVLLALVGAVLALTYYLLFLVLAGVLLVLGRLRRAALFCAAIAVLTAVFWVPLAFAVVGGSAAQGHFLRPDFLEVSTGIGGPAALAILAAVGIVGLVATIHAPASRAVAGVLVGTAVYQLLSLTTLVFAHDQLQPHRAVTMMSAAFGAAVPVALDALRRPGTALDHVPPGARRTVVVAALALAVPALFALGARQGTDEVTGPLTKAAHRPVHLTATDEISRFVTATTGRRPQDLTLLTGDKALMITQPYWGFLPLRARYAHPEAHLDERLDVVRAAAACPDAACTERRLEGSRFGPIEVLVLARTPSGFRIDSEEDGFPTPRLVSITFPRHRFPATRWVRRDVGVYTAFVRVG